jgi:hypothetical protein
MFADYNGSESSGDCSICNSNNDDEDNNQATVNHQATANTQAASAIPTATGNRAPVTHGGNHNNSTIKPCSPSLTISTLPSALKLFLGRGSANTSALSLFLGSAPGNTAARPSCFPGIGAGCVAGY